MRRYKLRINFCYTRRQKFLRIIINQSGAEYSYFLLGAQAQRDSLSLLASRELHSLCAAIYVAQYKWCLFVYQ